METEAQAAGMGEGMSRELYPFDLGYTDVIKLQDEINKLQAELELSRKIVDEAIKNTDILQAKLASTLKELNKIRDGQYGQQFSFNIIDKMISKLEEK